MATEQIQIPPFSVEIDGLTFTIHEVTKTVGLDKKTLYCVSVSVNYKGIQSKIVPFIVKDTQDLKNKLKIEATKLKWMELALGLEEVKRRIT